MLATGAAWMVWLKMRADKDLGDGRVWGGDMAFILLLFLIATSGLALYGFGAFAFAKAILAIQLGAVLSLFLLTPYSKMAHGFYRFTAMLKAD